MIRVLIVSFTAMFLAGCAFNGTPALKNDALKSEYYQSLLKKCEIAKITDTFNCSGKNLKDSDFYNINLIHLEGIKYIDLSHNNLTHFPFGLESLTTVKKLNLSYNKISYPEILLENMVSLKTLDLSHNNIKLINYDTFYNSNITSLNLSYNNIKHINPVIFKNRKVDIEGNLK